MAWTKTSGGYVKFLRGTHAFWNSLSEKDNDTLYFISEANEQTGELYLGNKQIGDGNGGSGSISLSNLQDVLMNNNITVPSLLVYNKTTAKWEQKSVSSVISDYVKPMTGASSEADGSGGLVPQPVQGQQNLFLRGDATWANPVSDVNDKINTLIGDDTGKTIREVAASEIAKVVANAPEAFDTLKEIADWIQNNDATADVVELQNAVFGTDNSDGLVEVVSNFGTDLANLTGRVQTLEGKTVILEGDVSALKEAMKWQIFEFVED